MIKNNILPQLITSYFTRYVPERSGYSENTIKSYLDTFILLFRYQEDVVKKAFKKLTFNVMDRFYIENFLKWLEEEKNYSETSLNQRLAGIHSFCRYVISEAPENMQPCTEILEIKMRKVPAKPMEYLSVDAIKLLFKIPNLKYKSGRRDLALLALLYDSGARVQAIADLTFGNIRDKKPATVKLTGKGNKSRIIPPCLKL